MASLKELRESRLEKLSKIKALGIDPYPAVSTKNIDNQKILEKFNELENSEVVVTGRVFSFRKHGKLSFIDLKDASGSIQIVLKGESLKSLILNIQN